MERCYCPYQMDYQTFGVINEWNQKWSAGVTYGEVTNRTPEKMVLKKFSQTTYPSQYGGSTQELSPIDLITVEPGETKKFTWLIAVGSGYPTNGRLFSTETTSYKYSGVDAGYITLVNNALHQFVIEKEEGTPFLSYKMKKIS